MPARLAPPLAQLATPAYGSAAAVVGVITEEAAATWIGIAVLAWTAALGCYDKWLASRRANEAADLAARLASVRAELAELEARRDREAGR